jgi:tRNA G37 N-methylase TrmD
MLNLNIDQFMVSFKDGSIENVGAPNKAATAKLFDVDAVELREFGDSQAKVVARDDEGNEIQIALFPEQVEALVDDAASMRDESRVFE